MDKKLAYRYLFEIIVIVFSVTLSFYIQEVLNDIEKKELKNRTLRGMLEDLEKSKEYFDVTDYYLKKRIQLAEKIIDTKKVTNYDLSMIVAYWDWGVFNASYEILISTGAAEYLNDGNLYIQIADFYHQTNLQSLAGNYKSSYIKFREHILENYTIESMIKFDEYIKAENETQMAFNFDKNSLDLMVKDEIFMNYVYNSISKITNIYFWERIWQEKYIKLKESIKKELES